MNDTNYVEGKKYLEIKYFNGKVLRFNMEFNDLDNLSDLERFCLDIIKAEISRDVSTNVKDIEKYDQKVQDAISGIAALTRTVNNDVIVNRRFN